jgi:serine protease AprX
MTSYVIGRLRPTHAHMRALGAIVAIVAAALTALLVSNWMSESSAGRAPSASPPAASPGNAPRSASGVLSPQLAHLASTDPGRRVEVIIQLSRGAGFAQGSRLVKSLGGKPGLDLHIINGLSARLTAGAARRAAASPLVRAVSLNALLKETTLVSFDPHQLGTVFDQSVRATALWNRSTGKGVGVAVLDTGIAGDVPDFRTSQSDTSSRVIASAVIDPGATSAGDTYGHGTLVGGLIAGNGGYRDSGDPDWGKYAGSAPDANLISIKMGDDNGQASTLDAIYGLQFAVDHKDAYNIRVINMSFRSTSAESYKTDPLDAAAEQAWFDGIVVVAAAGNRGSDSDAVSYSPGNDPYVLTVGAVDDQGTRWPGDDVVTSWSSRGTTQDGFSKPDVLAPGAHLVSTLAPASAFSQLCPTCVTDGSYFQASGTSLAAPVVAGVAADLLAAHPDWTPNQVKGAIIHTASALQSGGSEVNANYAYYAGGWQLSSNQGLTPNNLIDRSSGKIDPTLASWSLASWSTATDPQLASWSLASWSCNDCASQDNGNGNVDPTLASWSVSWATMWG